ncbi:hypothetical protein I5168_11980 [Nonlabens sp. SCSIO 43208]|uniref:hypothetical protein n=1 Tax=Nonlabens sp. SCSIO 43208 TaxID=2793009 RepID=UPI003D6B326F
MKQAIQVRTNLYYIKDEKENFEKINEIIVLCHKHTYKLNNQSQIVRESGIEELRFTITQENAKAFMETFQNILDADEKDLS